MRATMVIPLRNYYSVPSGVSSLVVTRSMAQRAAKLQTLEMEKSGNWTVSPFRWTCTIPPMSQTSCRSHSVTLEQMDVSGSETSAGGVLNDLKIVGIHLDCKG